LPQGLYFAEISLRMWAKKTNNLIACLLNIFPLLASQSRRKREIQTKSFSFSLADKHLAIEGKRANQMGNITE